MLEPASWRSADERRRLQDFDGDLLAVRLRDRDRAAAQPLLEVEAPAVGRRARHRLGAPDRSRATDHRGGAFRLRAGPLPPAALEEPAGDLSRARRGAPALAVPARREGRAR